MKKNLLSIFKYIFFLGLGFFLVWWQFDKMTSFQKSQFAQSLQNANYRLLFPVIILALLSHISRAVRWKILMAPMGYYPSTANTFYSVMTGYLVNTFVPRAGEIVKCTLLNRYEKIPTNKLIGTVLVERTFDLACYFIFILLTILIQIKYVGAFIKKKFFHIAHRNQGAIWIKSFLLITVIIFIIFFLKWIFKKFAHHRHIISIKGFHIGLKEGFNAIAHLKNRGWFIFHTIFMWLMYVLQIYVGFSALSATAHLGIVQACSVLSLATLGMIISPGGIGAFPLAVQEVLKIYNVDNASFGWLIWGVATGIIIIGGLISFGLLIYTSNRFIEEKTLNETKQ